MFDANRELAWSVNNDELGGIFNDVCGLQVLKSGNILVSTCARTTAQSLTIEPADQRVARRVGW